MQTAHFSAARDGIEIEAMLVCAGSDVAVIVAGGDAPHIGAVAAGGADGALSVTAFPKHKEAELAAELAAKLQKSGFPGHFVVSCGIHIDNITREEIALVLALSRELFDRILDFLKKDGEWNL